MFVDLKFWMVYYPTCIWIIIQQHVFTFCIIDSEYIIHYNELPDGHLVFIIPANRNKYTRFRFSPDCHLRRRFAPAPPLWHYSGAHCKQRGIFLLLLLYSLYLPQRICCSLERLFTNPQIGSNPDSSIGWQ